MLSFSSISAVFLFLVHCNIFAPLSFMDVVYLSSLYVLCLNVLSAYAVASVDALTYLLCCSFKGELASFCKVMDLMV